MEGGGLLLRGGSRLVGCGGIAGRLAAEGGSVETETGADVDGSVDVGTGVDVEAGVDTDFVSSLLAGTAAEAPAVFMRPFSRRY
jgi:hypothetical protein